MAANKQLPAHAYSRRERPWLLPHNRKLRHLHGITIRNVTLPQLEAATRPRGKTIDDEGLPHSLKSPAKILAQRETREKELAHSRSSSDLKAINEARALKSEDRPLTGDGSKASPTKPQLNRLRRRSTAEWTNASPLQRQKKLEHIAAVRMVDSFFSIHLPGQEEPIYVSETAEKAMNPNFRFFDLDSCGPAVMRRDDLTVKLFVASEHTRDYQFLLELTLNLSSLQFIGSQLESFHHPLPDNAVVFHLTDGIYTSFTNLPATGHSSDALVSPTLAPKSSANRVLPTSSYDALMRLSTLDACIQDALATRDSLASQITSILDENREGLSKIERVPEAAVAASRVSYAATAQGKRLEATRRRRDELAAALIARRDSMRRGREAQGRASHDIATAGETLNKSREFAKKTADDMVGQRRRCCEDLQSIYLIEPLPNKSLAFTIRGLFLPNSDFEDVNETEVAAALGHVAQVVHLLSFYLSYALPYPIRPRGSTSTIEDPISDTTEKNRLYPLHMKNAVRFRFEYGVFLLNKNIEILANGLGLRIMDIRQTLPNLKYLLYIATAGKGELPSRKTGGIKALLRGKAEGSGQTPPSMSRVGSTDSTDGYAKAKKGTGTGKGAVKDSDRFGKRALALPSHVGHVS